MHDGVGVFSPVPSRAYHGPVEAAARREDAGGVDQNDLRLPVHANAAHGEARGLDLLGDDRDLGADQTIDQRRLARIGRSDDGDETGSCWRGS
mgnify:CR=1 FL=1